MAHTKTIHIGQWDNYHFNGPFPTKTLFDISNDKHIPALVDRYNDAAKEIQRLIQDSVDNNERFRAFGSGWSLSTIAHQKDRMLFNAMLNIKLPITDNFYHPQTTYAKGNLFFFQCGITVKEISEFLYKKGKSLKTCGASNGQTIGGAMSTGVHGSAIDVGSIQDYIVGINLIIGNGPTDIVYVERKSKPALTDDFALSINARVMRDDDLFNAALVSLGSFGMIHGVAVEAEDLYLLKRYVKRINRTDALQIAENMNFSIANFKVAEEQDANGQAIRPYHYKLYINPYKKDEDFVAEIIYKKPFRVNYPDPIPRVKKNIFKDIPDWIASFAAKHRRFIPAILGALQAQAFPKLDEVVEGTLGEIFWDTTNQGAAFGSAIGIDNKDATKALDVMEKLMLEKGPIPGILSMRFVKASKATLAFTKFPMTCILEVDGILWQGNQNMISLEEFLRAMVEALMASGIQFTFHWGKHAAWDFPGLIDYMYGEKDNQWKNIRNGLLSKRMGDIFSNQFLDTIKLSF